MAAELAAELHKGFKERPLVADLLREHAEAVGTLRASLQSVEGAVPFAADDVWLLRFVLSYPKPDEAAIVRTLWWFGVGSTLAAAAAAASEP